MTITVVVAEDEALVRAGCVMLMGTAPDIEVLGQANNGAEAVELAGALRPDVVLMDLRMPEMTASRPPRRSPRPTPAAMRTPRGHRRCWS